MTAGSKVRSDQSQAVIDQTSPGTYRGRRQRYQQIHEAFLDVSGRRFVRRVIQSRREEARDVLVANLRSHDLGDHLFDTLVAAKTLLQATGCAAGARVLA